MDKLQVIGIIGHNFCGSTYLSRLLGCFPNVKAGGELHWIFRPQAPYEIKTVAGWYVRRSCVVCGRGCKAFTQDFIAQGYRPFDFYPAAAKQLNAKILVSSDKLPQHYRSFMQPKKMDGIVLFKDPIAALWSDFKNEKRKPEDSLLRWASLYKGILAWAPVFCRRCIFVKYQDISKHPDVMLQHFKNAFDIRSAPLQSSEIDNIPYHFIGGNPGAHQKKGIIADESYRTQLHFDAFKKTFESNNEAKAIYQSLLERSIKI